MWIVTWLKCLLRGHHRIDPNETWYGRCADCGAPI